MNISNDGDLRRQVYLNLLLQIFFFSALIGQGISYGKVYSFHIVFVLLLPYLWRKIQDCKLTIETLLPLSLGLYTLLSLCWSRNFSYGLIENVHIWLGIGTVLILSISRSESRIFDIPLRIVMWLSVLISLGEGLGLFRYPLSQFSSLAGSFGKNTGDWIPQVVDWPTGFHWNANNNAFFFLIFTPLVMRVMKVWERWCFYLLSSVVIYLSGSKLILIGWFLLSIGLGIVLLKKQSRKKQVLSLGGISLCLLISLIVLPYTGKHRLGKYGTLLESLPRFAVIIPDIFAKRFRGQDVQFNYMDRDISLHERLTYLDGLAQIISREPLFGVGAGGLKDESNIQGEHKVVLATPHFYVFEMWAKYGIFYLLFWFGWMICLGRLAFRTDGFFALSFALFFLCNPVMSSVSYFLPVWALFGYIIQSSRAQIPNV